jgi:hypothetical protein
VLEQIRVHGKKKGPNLPTAARPENPSRKVGVYRTDPEGPPEIDSQADCVGSQLERPSNKLEPP